jgi:GNAT superfamily N-acetyltransferase
MSLPLDIRDESYDGPSARRLIEAVQAEYVQRYGGPDDSPVDPGEFAPPGGVFLIGYLAGEPVASGGFRGHGDGEVEIKRMFVAPQVRGQGLSRLILAALEERARASGATRVVLETGEVQPEAIGLYESSGYARVDGFGYYKDAPLSISFAKPL